MPPMSPDGGDEAEFMEYWRENEEPYRWSGDWLEYRTHPQVNVQPFWYNESSQEISYEEPGGGSERLQRERREQREEPDDGLEELSGEGPAWSTSVTDLKDALFDGNPAGIPVDELARRAVSIYEGFQPRVLSWHDFQHLTFWFFGGMKRRKQGGAGGSFFQGGAGREMFASPDFFRAVSEAMRGRMHRMHPICLTYLIWTFSRAEVVLPRFMTAVGDHLCRGYLPMMDRCSLGTMVWNFSKQSLSHDRLFERAAAELSRPNRVRSLAPRNFQNVLIAYSRRRHQNRRLVSALCNRLGMVRQMDEHEDCGGKLARELLFAYTCKDGSEVLADSFRISSLSVILKSLRQLSAEGDEVTRCIESMLDYTHRCIDRAPAMCRDPGDAMSFLLEVANTARDLPSLELDRLLERADWDAICAPGPQQRNQRFAKDPRQQKASLRGMLLEVGVKVPAALDMAP